MKRKWTLPTFVLVMLVALVLYAASPSFQSFLYPFKTFGSGASETVGFYGTNGTTYVAPWGHNTTGDGSIYNPYLTISNACTKTPMGGHIHAFGPANYIESDIYWSGIITGDDTANLDYDSNNGQTGSIFQDANAFGTGGYTNVNLRIIGFSYTNLVNSGGQLFTGYGPGTQAYIETRGDILGDPANLNIYFDPYSYSAGGALYAAPPYSNHLVLKCRRHTGSLWLGEGSGNVEFSIEATNTYLFFDRDTTTYSPPWIFRCPIMRNCQVVAQRPWNSQVILDVALWYAGPINVAANNSGPNAAVVSCLFGNCTFLNTTFVMPSGQTHQPFAYLSSANTGYAIVDTNHAGNLTLINCSVVYSSGNTNALIWSKLDVSAAVGVSNRVQFVGTFNSCNALVAGDNSFYLDGASIFTTNATWLTNYYPYNP